MNLLLAAFAFTSVVGERGRSSRNPGSDARITSLDAHATAADPLGSLADLALDAEESDGPWIPIPYAMLRSADGSLRTLRELPTEGAVLLVMLSSGCGPCMRVADRLDQWREQLEPLIRIEVVFPEEPEQIDQRMLEMVGQEPWRDPENNVQRVFDLPGLPAAALLGVDGFVADHPALGGMKVIEMVTDMIAELAEITEHLPE